MNVGFLLAAAIIALLATLWMISVLDGFLAFIPLIALGLMAAFWGFRRSAA